MDRTFCKRCGKETNKLFMFQTMEYCGRMGKRKDLCSDCWRSLVKLFNQEGANND